MRYDNIGDAKTLNGFVKKKLEKFQSMKRDFSSLYSMMFSESGNTLFESNNGYKIKKISYGEGKCNAERRADTLRQLLQDARRGDAVGIYLNNGVEWIEVFWAVLICGFRPLLLNVRLDDETLEKALADVGAVAVISGGKTFGKRTILLEELKLSDRQYAGEAFGEEILVMSSGTSKSVKVCAYGPEQFFAIVMDSIGVVRDSALVKRHYRGELKLLAFLPFYHIFGLVAVYIWFAFFSRTFVALNSLEPDTLLDTIRRHKVTHIFAVPLFWQTIYNEAMKTIRQRGEKTYRKFQKGLRISNKLGNSAAGRAFAHLAFREVRENLFGESISFMITGGSMIDPKVLAFFNGIGYRLANGYGMTEIGITSVELSDRRKTIISGSVGVPLLSAAYKLENGVLLVKGKGRAKYILENGIKTEMPEWFATKDLAEVRGGRYYISGRRDDLIVSVTGENLNPNLIEEKFDFPGVQGVCLIADKENLPVLLVSVGKYVSREKAVAIDAYIRARIGEINLSSEIKKIVLTTDPLMTGDEIKLDRIRLKSEYEQGKLKVLDFSGNAGEENYGELENKVRELFAVSLGKQIEDVGFETDFFLDEGGTSLDYMTLISRVKHEFGVDFPDMAPGELNSVAAMSNFIKRHT